MQSTPARDRGYLWLRWGRVLALGVALGLLQFLLLYEAEAIGHWFNSGLMPFGLGALLYVLLPGLETLFTVQRNRNVIVARRFGLIVGIISVLVLGGTLLILVALTPLPPSCLSGGACSHSQGKIGAAVTGPEIFFAFILVEGFGGIICTLIGGWLGSSIGARLAPTPNPGRRTSAENLR